jgi:hypothetical protein
MTVTKDLSTFYLILTLDNTDSMNIELLQLVCGDENPPVTVSAKVKLFISKVTILCYPVVLVSWCSQICH